MRVVIYLGGELALDIFVRRSIFVYEGCSEDFLNLFFSFSFRYIFLVHWSCDHLVIANNVFIIDIYIYIYLMMLLSHFHLSLHVLFLFSLYTFVSYYCMQSLITVSH